jgi:hypothetical protein
MRRPPGAVRLLAVTAALAAATAGCHSASPGTGGGGPTVTPERSRSEVIQALHDAWRGLTPLNVTAPNGAHGSYTQCVDQGGSVEYIADFRVDPKLATDPPLADRLDPALSAAGWVMEAQPTPTGTGVVSRGSRGNLRISVNTYTDAELPFALFQILGPCLEVGDADQSYTTKSDKNLPLT